MSDFTQWRLKVHTPKSWIPPIVEADEKPRFNENIFTSSSAGSASATLPKRKSRPRLKSYFGGHSHQSTEPEHFLLDKRPTINTAAGKSSSTIGTVSEISRDTASPTETLPDVELSITALTSRLLSDPGKGLTLQDTSLVLRIMESYRELTDRIAALKEDLANESEKTKRTAEELQQLETIRAADEKDFRAEVKRLEMIIAEGKRGMADLVKVRQGSIIRRSRNLREGSSDDRDSRGEHTQKSRDHTLGEGISTRSRHEKQINSVRLLPQSPSRVMANLSRQFSISGLQQENSLRMHSSGYETFVQSEHSPDFLTDEANAGHAEENESSSTSSYGDALSDEYERTPIADNHLRRNEAEVVRQMADILAIRQGVQRSDVMPGLLQLFPHRVSDFEDASGKVFSSNNGAFASPESGSHRGSEIGKPFPSSHNDNHVASDGTFDYELVSPKTSVRRFSFCPNEDETIKLRESWNCRKTMIDGFEENRPVSTSRRTSDTSFQTSFSKTSAKHSLQEVSRTPQSSVSAEMQYRPNYHSLTTDNISTVNALATMPSENASSGSELGLHFQSSSAGTFEPSTLSNHPYNKTHPSARFPSSGSQQSTITAIWQNTGVVHEQYCDREDHRHQSYNNLRCDSARSSLSPGSRTFQQNMKAQEQQDDSGRDGVQ